MTWPLATRLGREIASDLGDPVFNCYVMTWTAGQVLAAFRGNLNAFHDYWHGNIFYPEQLTIAYSEHLTPQMLQALPVYATTGNIVLAYNLLFLSTFVLSGFGMYLFVKELTGNRSAAFVAGLAFAFAPYRMSQYSHLQVLSTYWMPLALYGLRRYFVTLRARPLAGAAAALALQNLSCGYYLLFFSPFAAAYCVYEMWRRRLLGTWRVWRSLAIAALGVALVTWPFLSPYLELRKSGDVGVRSYEEAVQFSADTYAFATAADTSWLWGKRLRTFPKGEGEGFPGFAILAFAALGIVWAVVPAARRAMRGSHDSAVGFFAGATVVAALLALGPRIMWAGQRIGAGPYLWLYENVPGFDGVRVPARYLMIVALFLAVLAGFGAAAVSARKRFGSLVLIAGSLAILAEGWAGPMPTNVRMAPFGFELTARRLATGDEVSPLYRWVRGAPGKLVLIEFPFGEPAYEILATFYAGYHRRPLVNGFSGFFPEGYLRRSNFLSRIPFDLEAATKALRSSGATHAIVHEAAFADGRGHELSDWLTSIGAKIIASDGHDKLFVLGSQEIRR